MVVILREDPGRWQEVKTSYSRSVFITADTFEDDHGQFKNMPNSQ